MIKEKYLQVNVPEVVFDIFDDEIILINMESGNYYSITNIAAKIWEQIGDGNLMQDIIRNVQNIFEGNSKEIEHATITFIEELLEEDLLKYSDKESIRKSIISENLINSGEKIGKQNFEKPFIKRYTDMQDLLILDPIHEVDESGWPNPLSDKSELK